MSYSSILNPPFFFTMVETCLCGVCTPSMLIECTWTGWRKKSFVNLIGWHISHPWVSKGMDHRENICHIFLKSIKLSLQLPIWCSLGGNHCHPLQTVTMIEGGNSMTHLNVIWLYTVYKWRRDSYVQCHSVTIPELRTHEYQYSLRTKMLTPMPFK
jgi:hypothetical protein